MAQNIQLSFNVGSYGPNASFSLGAPSGTVTPATITVSEIGAAGGSINVTVSDDSVRAITVTAGGVSGACTGTQRIVSWSVPTDATTIYVAPTTLDSGGGSGETTTSSGSGSGSGTTTQVATTADSGGGSGATTTQATTQSGGGSGGGGDDGGGLDPIDGDGGGSSGTTVFNPPME